MTEQLPSDQRFHVCPDCKCQFVQPFVCITCGAEKLYDATTHQQAETIVAQERRIAELEEALRIKAVEACAALDEWRKQGFCDVHLANVMADGRSCKPPDERCEDCGGWKKWCPVCYCWTKTCCVEYGTCQCS